MLILIIILCWQLWTNIFLNQFLSLYSTKKLIYDIKNSKIIYQKNNKNRFYIKRIYAYIYADWIFFAFINKYYKLLKSWTLLFISYIKNHTKKRDLIKQKYF